VLSLNPSHYWLIILCLLFALPAQAKVYKWIDEHGKTHYGENLPEKYKAQSIDSSKSNIMTSGGVAEGAYYYVIEASLHENNTDRFGSDLRKIYLKKNAKARQCRTACDKDKRCMAWTFMKPQYSRDETQTSCYLKYNLAKPEHNPCCISGTKRQTITNMAKMEAGIDYFGAGLRKFKALSNDPLECIAACSKDKQCKAWTFGKIIPQERPVAMCWLKAAVPGAKENSSTVSGLKVSM